MNAFLPPCRRRSGVAIVIVLAFLVLLTFLVVAFLSRAMIERQVSAGTTAKESATLLSRSVATDLVNDLLDEMRYGNNSKDLAGASLSPADRLTKSYPSAPGNATPQRILGANDGLSNCFNLVKMSVSGQPLYSKSAFPDGPPDADKIVANGGSTAVPSKNGRSLNAGRWNKMAILPDTTGFTTPDWIRITRKGPEKLGQGITVADAKNPASDNYVIGRYAFTIANLGGMLDINVLGNGFPVTDDFNTTRNRLHQADFTAIRADGSLNETELRKRLVEWRWGAANASDKAWLLDSKSSFLEPAPGQNILFSRNELLAFQQQNSDILTVADLAYLTVDSYEKNAPNFDAENHNAPGFDKAVNQSVSRTLFTAGPKKGQRIFSRRFDLHRIDLLKNGGSAADIQKYFGLQQLGSNDDWKYVGTAPSGPGFIRTLSDIAKDPANPEPNFFEILKAVINQNTLGIDQGGGTASNTFFKTLEQQRTPDYQIFQIGANIIDQWDADDNPTCIQSSAGDSFWGVENLPYINQMFQWASTIPRDTVVASPGPGRRFYQWFVPEMWNPHRNAVSSTITDFRIVGIGSVLSALKSAPLIGATGWHDSNNKNPTLPIVYHNYQVDLTKCQITFNINQALGSTQFSDPTLIRQGTVGIDPSAGYNADYALADTTAQAGAADTNFLGLWAGAINVPDGDNADQGSTLVGATDFGFELQYLKGGVWRTYQRFERFQRGIGAGMTGRGRTPYTALMPMGSWTVSDPRCNRATRTDDLSPGGADGETAPENTCFRFTWVNGGTCGPYSTPNIIYSDHAAQGTWTPESTTIPLGDVPGLLLYSGTQGGLGPDGKWGGVWPMSLGATRNTYEKMGANDNRWALKDRDNSLRFADAASLPLTWSDFSVISSGKGPLTLPAPVSPVPYRPLILNRPFRNVGELGYVLRDQPWKTLNFSLVPYLPSTVSATDITPGLSADSGLLEVFTLVDSDAVAGKVDLNTRNTRVLESLLRGAEGWIPTRLGTANRLSDSDATTIAANMAASTAGSSPTATKPLANVANLATYVTQTSATGAQDGYNNAKWIFPNVTAAGISKEQLEAPLRCLSALGTTRTWNLGVDLVVQVGRYAPNATDPGKDFIMEGQQRYFLTLIFDRIEGTLISSRMEPVLE